MRVANHRILSTTFNNTTTYSDNIPVEHLEGYQLMVRYTGSSIAGSLVIQETPVENPLVDDDWDDVEDSTVAISAAGKTTFNRSVGYARWMRLKVVSSDTDNMTVTADYCGKGSH